MKPSRLRSASFGFSSFRFLALAPLGLLPAFTSAAIFTVTSLDDSPTAAANDGTLRGALLAANADTDPTASEIVFNIPGGGTVALAANASGARMLPILSNPNGISINGNNSGQGSIIIDGGSTSDTTGDRIFFVGISPDTANPPTLVVTPAATFTLSNLALRNGNARGGNGILGGGGGAGFGGAIFANAGTLSLSNLRFEGNRAVGGGSVGTTSTTYGGGGGGMGGNVAQPIAYGTGGGGFGLGADAPNQSAGMPGSFPGGFPAGNGAGTGAFSGGAQAGGGGAASSNGGAGGGGFGGVSGTATSNGSGGFGGGGAGSATGVFGVAGSGGFGGGCGGSMVASSSKAGFGGGAGSRSGSTGAGFGGGIPATPPVAGYPGGGAGFGGALFVRQGSALSLGSGLAYSQNRSVGGVGASVSKVSNQGLGLAPSLFLDAASVPGFVSLTGDTALNAETTLAVSIAGTTAGSTHGQLKVTGTINLANARLALTGAHVPVAGNSFTVIDNDGNDPITGTFFNLPEGAVVPLNGVQLVASYVGGDGNDFTLSVPASPLASPSIQIEQPTGTVVTSRDFGPVTNNGGSVTRTFTLRNTSAAGSYPLSVFDLLKLGKNQSEFLLDTSLTAGFLSSGQSTTFDITFKPNDTPLDGISIANRYSGLRLLSNSTASPNLDLALTGTAPFVYPLTFESPAGNFLTDGTVVDLGQIDSTNTSAFRQIKVTNLSTASVTLDSSSFQPLTILIPTLYLVSIDSLIIAPGSSTTFTVGLNYSTDPPIQSGLHSMTLTMKMVGDTRTFKIPLVGRVGPALIDTWKLDHFGGATANTGDLEDFDGDGVSNLLEFAMGSDPTSKTSGVVPMQLNPYPTEDVPGSPIVTTLTLNSVPTLVACYPIRFDSINNRNGLTYQPQFSPDLISWFDAAEGPQVMSLSPGYEFGTVPYPATVNGQPTVAFRVAVTLDPNVR